MADAAEFERVEIVGADGYAMAARRYVVPASVPTQPLALCRIHGIQSHVGWYERSCRRYAAAGIDTWFLDRRGSGANRLHRGHCESWRQLVDDLYRFVDRVRQRSPGKKVAVEAISWGGKIALAAEKIKPGFSDALVFVAPGWFAKVSPSLREKLAIGWSAFAWPRRRIAVPLSDPALFTADAKWQQFLRDDEASLRYATARLFMSSKLLDGFLKDAPAAVATPCLLQLAGQDRIVDNAMLRAFFQRFAVAEKRIAEYQEAHHTLEFEPNVDDIVDDSIGFLVERLSESRATAPHAS